MSEPIHHYCIAAVNADETTRAGFWDVIEDATRGDEFPFCVFDQYSGLYESWFTTLDDATAQAQHRADAFDACPPLWLVKQRAAQTVTANKSPEDHGVTADMIRAKLREALSCDDNELLNRCTVARDDVVDFGLMFVPDDEPDADDDVTKHEPWNQDGPIHP